MAGISITVSHLPPWTLDFNLEVRPKSHTVTDLSVCFQSEQRGETLVGTSANPGGMRLACDWHATGTPKLQYTPSLSLADLVRDCQSIHPGRVARRKVMWTVDHNLLKFWLLYFKVCSWIAKSVAAV